MVHSSWIIGKNYGIIMQKVFVGGNMRLMLPFKTHWEEHPSLAKEIGLNKMVAPIISVVGAGGKTSTIEYLAEEYKSFGEKLIITTTTHMFQPTQWSWCKEESMEIVERYLETEDVVWVGIPCESNKIKSPSEAFLESLKECRVPLLVEADGAKRLPFKVPGDKEPVFLEGSSIVIGVLGIDALGKPLKEVCFRSNLAGKLLYKSEEEILTEEDFVEVITSEWGLKKGVKRNMDFLVILNKVDNKKREIQARRIRNMVQEKGISNLYITSYRE